MCRTYNGGDINADEDYFYNIIKDLINTKEVKDYGLYSHAQKKKGRALFVFLRAKL